MGLEIGAIPAVLAVTRERRPSEQALEALRTPNPRTVRQPENATQARSNAPVSVFGGAESPDAQIGFGDGTVMPSGEAVRTLGTSLRLVRDMIPSDEERAQQAADRAKAATEQAQQTSASIPLDLTTPARQAVHNAQDFINTLNRVAGVAAARVEGRAADTATTAQQPPIQVNGQAIPYVQRQPVGQFLNLLA